MKSRVYVVDPDRQHRTRITKIAERLGLTTTLLDSGRQLLKQVDNVATGCIVTELRTPEISGIQLLEQLAKRDGCLPVIVLTAYAKTTSTVGAMQRGALTVLDKPADEEAVSDAFRRALILSDKLRRDQERRRELSRRFDSLTRVESRVAASIVKGCTNREIAESDRVSVRTIESRRQKVYQKLGITSLQELVELTLQFRRDNRYESHLAFQSMPHFSPVGSFDSPIHALS